MKDIVVIGGGTAGWITALACQVYFPNTKITVIESQEIGVIGVGEGTVPVFVDFLDLLGIPTSDIFKHCRGAIKSSIRFTNWHGDGTVFHHPFTPGEGMRLDELNSANLNHTDLGLINALANDDNLLDVEFMSRLTEGGKVPFIKNGIGGDSPIDEFDKVGAWALHFDARMLADFFRRVGIERGITHVDGKVSNIIQNDDGVITSVVLENGDEYPTSFVFDCSGFARLIVDKFSSWNSFRAYLPCDKAMPFNIPTDKVDPYTEARAMKYGWMWRIPVQGRDGCGYVFDSRYVGPFEAYKEIEEMFGPVEIPKIIDFNPGCYRQIWNKNSCAIGLAAGFVEPLESTSIWLTVLTLTHVLSKADAMISLNQKEIDAVNKRYVEITEQVVSFLHFHYITERDDTQFWRDFTHINARPEYLENLMQKVEGKVPEYEDFDPRFFDLTSWMYVGIGTRFFKKSQVQGFSDVYLNNNLVNSIYSSIVQTGFETQKNCVTHGEFIEAMLK